LTTGWKPIHGKQGTESMIVYPTELARPDDRQLAITWSDGQQRIYRVGELRDRCPCATCREKRNTPQPILPVLTAEQTQPIRVDGMKPVGNYAYAITFSDGHDSGIYTFELLRELGTEE
jgi:DUF971 family protein